MSRLGDNSSEGKKTINIPQHLWHKTLLVEDVRKFEKMCIDDEKYYCVHFVMDVMDPEEIKDFLRLGFKQIKIGLNTIIY